MADFTPWKNLSQPQPEESGTKRDFANMLNEKLPKKRKKARMGTHWELPKKLKLDGF